jgi:hypothetical protein
VIVQSHTGAEQQSCHHPGSLHQGPHSQPALQQGGFFMDLTSQVHFAHGHSGDGDLAQSLSRIRKDM